MLLHGFPSGLISSEFIGNDLPELADRIALEMGWVAVAARFRGCGTSRGNFSMQGWLEDARAVLRYLRRSHDIERICLVGFGTGGAMALALAAGDDSVDAEISGVAVIGTPADFSDWATHPNDLLAHARRSGAVSDDEFPADAADWSAQLAAIKPAALAEQLEVPLLVLHGSMDDRVPAFDARMVADAHGSADLRLISGAGHQLRHDPRAVAILLGWLERQRNA